MVSASSPGSSAKPGAMSRTSHGAPIMPAAQITAPATSSAKSAPLARRRASSGPASCSACATPGIRAPVRPSSATKRRKRLGTVHASQKVSEARPAPKTGPMAMSRTAPSTRDSPGPSADTTDAPKILLCRFVVTDDIVSDLGQDNRPPPCRVILAAPSGRSCPTSGASPAS